jgi:aspartate racemase
MQTIGLVGGMSWHSTAAYYRRINEQVAARRGGHASARISLQSLDFAEVRDCQLRGDWAGSARLLAEAAARCEAGGADLVALCTNLMHKNFAALEAAVTVPAVHIADAVAAVARREGWTTLGLLGARWVMEETFYAERLAGHGIAVVVPDAAGRELVDRVVFDEITQGVFLESSRTAYTAVMGDLAARGADAVVLACTEIGLLVDADRAPLPAIDSATAHADLLVDLALAAVPAAPGPGGR